MYSFRSKARPFKLLLIITNLAKEHICTRQCKTTRKTRGLQCNAKLMNILQSQILHACHVLAKRMIDAIMLAQQYKHPCKIIQHLLLAFAQPQAYNL